MSTTTDNLELFLWEEEDWTKPESESPQFEIQKTLNNNWNKINNSDKAIKQTIKNLQSEKEQLKQENERLREDLKGLPKGAFSGEVIDLNDSAEMRLQSLEIQGNSRQETREGYNKLPNNVTTTSINGINFIVNKDGTVLANGTATANTILQLNNGVKYSANTYRLSGCPQNGASDTYRFDLMNKSNSGIPVIDIGDGAEFTITEELTLVPRIRIQNGVTINNLLFKPMIVRDISKTIYEQFGASPTPEYPSEIECCGDNINLFINEDMENAYINSDGDYIGNGNNALYPFMKVNTKTIYCTSANVQMANMVFVEYDKNKNFIKRNVLGNIQNGTYQLSENCNYIRFNCNYKNGVNITKDFIDTLEIKIEEGSTPTLYSKFGQGNITFEMCNVNLAKTSSIGQHGTPIIKFSEKYTGPLTIAMKPASGNTQVNYRFFYADGTAGGDNSVTLINTENNKWYCINLNVKDVIGIGTYNTVHQGYTSRTLEKQFIAKGQYSIQSDNDYEEHKSQTYTIPTQKPFRKIDTYKDTFIRKNGKWYERHLVERKIFDGTENVYDFRTWGDFYRIFIAITGAKKYSTSLSNGQLCSHFKYDNNGAFGLNEHTINGIFAQYTNTSQFYFVTDKTSIELFKSWLAEQYNAGTPVYIDYVLLEPEDIECTPEQTEILDKIENEAKTYKGVTHIYSTDKISPIFEGTYNKDIETMINNISKEVIANV